MDINEWVLCNDDCLLYRRSLGDRRYELIEMMWLDTTSEDEGYPDHEYIVVSAEVDLNDYDSKDIAAALSSYCYKEDELVAEYGRKGADDLIAECIFEDENSFDFESEMMTKDEAERFIERYVSRDSGKGRKQGLVKTSSRKMIYGRYHPDHI